MITISGLALKQPRTHTFVFFPIQGLPGFVRSISVPTITSETSETNFSVCRSENFSRKQVQVWKQVLFKRSLKMTKYKVGLET